MGRIPGQARRAALATVAAAAVCWPGADVASARGDWGPDAQIFASSTTAIITDPGDPRLADRLLGFSREVKRIIRRGGGVARRSRLLEVRARVMGASITLGGRLMLVAALQDLSLVERFVTALGVPFGDATVRRGHREFVAAA